MSVDKVCLKIERDYNKNTNNTHSIIFDQSKEEGKLISLFFLHEFKRRDNLYGYSKFNRIEIDSGEEVRAFDEFRFRHLRNVHHPFLLLYNEKNALCPNRFMEEGVKERMAYLKIAYPRLDPESSTQERGDLKYPQIISPMAELMKTVKELAKEFGM